MVEATVGAKVDMNERQYRICKGQSEALSTEFIVEIRNFRMWALCPPFLSCSQPQATRSLTVFCEDTLGILHVVFF